MPHADSALIPPGLDKSAFWNHVYEQLGVLLEGQRNWVTNLANASSLIYSSLLAFDPFFGHGERTVNWCGFYLASHLLPSPRLSRPVTSLGDSDGTNRLLLGPFCGKPACQFINTTPGKARGVCADAFLKRETVLVPDVDAYPGHIACDGETKSEIVCPLILNVNGTEVALGVLDLDCLALDGFTEEDKEGLTRIAELIVKACDW
ncbi:GAF domain-like protein [Wolfiporia cocos MD-104 SS10]|uniref:GAF domain-like protein n=1 Tax=Wolfiporia cocos (strain MD-104) TaxID=742152 RepID=A0A2H3J2S9_WOLCO|nr:GAF domain-like protein [Wolfiporia cocos MD-104 SS10]